MSHAQYLAACEYSSSKYSNTSFEGSAACSTACLLSLATHTSFQHNQDLLMYLYLFVYLLQYCNFWPSSILTLIIKGLAIGIENSFIGRISCACQFVTVILILMSTGIIYFASEEARYSTIR